MLLPDLILGFGPLGNLFSPPPHSPLGRGERGEKSLPPWETNCASPIMGYGQGINMTFPLWPLAIVAKA